jgi:hypothetical protein
MKNLTIEIQRVWRMIKVIPVTASATAPVSDSFRNEQSNMPGKQDINKLQKTSIFGTALILRKVLM